MKLVKTKDSNGIKCFKYDLTVPTKKASQDKHKITLSKIDRDNLNHDFGCEGYSVGDVEYRRTFCDKTVKEKPDNLEFSFILPKNGIYELKEEVVQGVYRKMFYQLKANGSFEPVNKEKAFKAMEEDRLVYEEARRKRLEEKREKFRQRFKKK